MVAHREAKEDASNKSAEMERRRLHDVWSDGVTNAEIWHRMWCQRLTASSGNGEAMLQGWTNEDGHTLHQFGA
jgi:hypothetical protein